MANIKRHPTLGQMNIKLHTKSLITPVPITQYIMPSFQPKITRHAKRQEKHSPERQSKYQNTTQI